MSSLPQPSPRGGAAVLGSRCLSCSSPLAADQLFCLSCGTRRRDARIPFRDVLATEAAPVLAGGNAGCSPVPPAGAVPGQPAGPTAYTPFLATLACLLLAVSVGVWIGRGQQPAPVVSAAPLAAAPAAVVASTPVAAAAEDGDAATSDDAAAKDAASADEASTPGAAEKAPATADTKKLESLSPSDYQKQATKLPKEVGTGGEAPAKDNKPAGGGTAFEDFN